MSLVASPTQFDHLVKLLQSAPLEPSVKALVAVSKPESSANVSIACVSDAQFCELAQK
jgi:hypothetical protein